MARCQRKTNLEVHHKRRDGGNELSNAEVLCPECHAVTSTYGVPGPSPSPFSYETKQQALLNANKQCQCTRAGGCH